MNSYLLDFDWLASDEIAMITFYELKNNFNLIYLINKEVDSFFKKHILCYFKKELFNLITSKDTYARELWAIYE